MLKKSNGNWAEDLGAVVQFMFTFALIGMILLPVLIIVIIVLIVAL